MDQNTIERAGKSELRKLCRTAGVQYSKLTVAKMRAALLAQLSRSDNRADPNERFSDTPRFKVIKKVSVLDLLRQVPVEGKASCEAIAKRAGARVASVRTVVASCNSKAPSNARFYKLGLRFELKRGEDCLKRTK